MSKWQPIWLALCFGIAFAANRGLAPKIAYEMSPALRTMPTGTIKVDFGGHSHEIKLATLGLVADELRPLFADAHAVRVLWMRSIEDGSGGKPDLELFVDLVDRGSAVDVHAPDLGFLRERDLGVLEHAPGSHARSHLRLPGDSAARVVRGGTLRVTRILPLDAGPDGARSRIEGSLELLLDGDAQAAARFDARLTR